jgi:U3 small nucleolar RNA-associated protein 13
LITAHRNLLLKQWDNWNGATSNLAIYPLKEGEKFQKITRCTRTWKAVHVAPITFMCIEDTSTLLATASSDYTTKIWDIKAQYCTHNLRGATGLLRYVAFYPVIEDKQQLVTGADDGKIRVYNLNTSKQDACLEGHYSAVTCFSYILGDDEKTYSKLMSSSRDKVIILWDLTSFAKLKTVALYESIESFILTTQITSLVGKQKSSDRFCLTMGNDGLLKVWDTKAGVSLYQQNENESLKIQNKRKSNESEELQSVITQGFYNKKTSTLIMVTTDQLIAFVRINSEIIDKLVSNESAKEINFDGLFDVYKQYVGDHGEILDLQYCNREENLLAMATNSEFLKIYDLNTWDCKLLKGHTDLIICLSSFVSKKPTESSYLASSSKDSTIRIWKITEVNKKEEEDDEMKEKPKSNKRYSYECVSVCQGHTQDVGTLCFSNLGLNFLVSGSIDTTLKLWKIDAKDGFKMSVAFTVKAHEKDINSVAVSPNDKLIASGSSDKTAKVNYLSEVQVMTNLFLT